MFCVECLPCILRMSIDTVKLCGGNNAVIRKLFDILRDYNVDETSPELIFRCQTLIREAVGCSDPYKEIKARDIHTSEIGRKQIAEMIAKGSLRSDIKTALLISAIGNTLDAGISLSDELNGKVQQEVEKSFAVYEGDRLEELKDTACSVLVIGDNVGEFAFDKFLFGQFEKASITYAVRSSPILNDITMNDVELLRIKNVKFISSGCTIPGTALSYCSDVFLNDFYNADIVIAKGLGNYETLKSEREVFYLFKAKCDIVARKIGVQIGEYVLTQKVLI